MENTISAVTWRTVHEHIVADALRSKNSSSALLIHEQQASQKWCLSSRHSTACGDYERTIYENIILIIYIFMKVNPDDTLKQRWIVTNIKTVTNMSPWDKKTLHATNCHCKNPQNPHYFHDRFARYTIDPYFQDKCKQAKPSRQIQLENTNSIKIVFLWQIHVANSNYKN